MCGFMQIGAVRLTHNHIKRSNVVFNEFFKKNNWNTNGSWKKGGKKFFSVEIPKDPHDKKHNYKKSDKTYTNSNEKGMYPEDKAAMKIWGIPFAAFITGVCFNDWLKQEKNGKIDEGN